MTDTNGGGEAGMQIDADLVRQLAELLNENDLTEIEVEDGARRIAVKRQVTVAAAAPAPIAVLHAAAPAAAAPASAALSDEASVANHPGTVKSPMVGTVYLSGEPGATPFTP